MTRQEHLLAIHAEECAETAQRASKALRFGLTEQQAGHTMNNAERLVEDFCHIKAMMEMLQSGGHIDKIHVQEYVNQKKINVEQFLKYSKECGTLQS